jgi:hypothetical protein
VGLRLARYLSQLNMSHFQSTGVDLSLNYKTLVEYRFDIFANTRPIVFAVRLVPAESALIGA